MPIINGVEVEGCLYLQQEDEEHDFICYAEESCGETSCDACTDCYFKQLQRVKAENEKLKQTLQEIKEIGEEDFRHTSWEAYKEQLKRIIALIKKAEEE